jgi:hypothetical protein
VQDDSSHLGDILYLIHSWLDALMNNSLTMCSHVLEPVFDKNLGSTNYRMSTKVTMMNV